jgi:hypothetical protein
MVSVGYSDIVSNRLFKKKKTGPSRQGRSGFLLEVFKFLDSFFFTVVAHNLA